MVRKEKLRVLFVDSEPRYEFRYLKNYLERDETIDLNVVLLSSDPKYSEQDRSAIPTFPAAKDDLFAYDVVIFGDADISYLSQSQLQNLVEFVTEQGGGVLFVAGELFNPLAYHGTPLELLLPIELSDARNPTAVGTTVSGVPAPAHARRSGQPDLPVRRRRCLEHADLGAPARAVLVFRGTAQEARALVLAEHDTAIGSDGKLPLILYQFVGTGKSMFHAFDDTWRWRYRAGDRYFGRFWVQTIRFLARSRLVGQRQAEVTTDRRRYQRGQPIQFRVRFPNPGLAPKAGDVDDPGRARRAGRAEARAQAGAGHQERVRGGDTAGRRRRLRSAAAAAAWCSKGRFRPTTFRVDAPINEFEHIEMNGPELLRTAESTGGKFYTPLDADALLRDLPKPSKVPLDTDPPIPLWNTWPLLTLFLVLLTVEWVFRKRKQMV